MTRILVVAAFALSTAACSSSNSDWIKSEADTSRAHAHTLNSDASDTDEQPLNGADVARHESRQDRQFVRDASAGGVYEVQASQLALQKTQDAHVRMIAEHMIHDHTQANQQLKETAQQVGLSVQSQPSTQQQQMISELNGLNGTDFDQRYIEQQTKAHQETIALFQKEEKEGQDASLRSFATQTLPTLQEHLRMITGNNNNISNER